MKKVVNINQNAITLIALVITIVVLLILAGVMISTLTGQNGLLNRVKIAQEKTEYESAKETVTIKIADGVAKYLSKENRMPTVTELATFMSNQEEIDILVTRYYETASIADGLVMPSTVNGFLVKDSNQIKYSFLIGQSCGIEKVSEDDGITLIEINEYEINKFESKIEVDTDKKDEQEENVENGIGDTQEIPSDTLNEITSSPLYANSHNIFDYGNGARVTYVTNPYFTSTKAINGGYTGSDTPIGNTSGSFWQATNAWNTQGCLENDESIDSIKYNHKSEIKNTNSATTLTGGSEAKQTIIIDPRAYYGDTQNYTFEVDDLYLASAFSDGDVGNYEIYISNGGSDVATNPNDSSWQYVTNGRLTEDTKLVNVSNSNLKFKYLKLILSSRDKGYMELAAIKGFKRYSETSNVKTIVKREENNLKITAIQEDVGIDKVEVENPNGLISTRSFNYYRLVDFEYRLTLNGQYKVRAFDKLGNISKEIQFTVSNIVEVPLYNYDGNLLNYNQGSRVTYVKNIYGSGILINNGYTGPNTPVNNTSDGFWQATNNYNVQGAVENDDSKSSIQYNHKGNVKSYSSATTSSGGSTTQQVTIITPRAYQGDTTNYLYQLKELYLASANADGDVGEYEIYMSTSDNSSVATNPNDSTWALLTSGKLTTDGDLVKIYDGNVKFRYIKIVSYARNKGYMEMAAVKAFQN